MIWPLAAAIFGLLIGSFLNVCIHRLPLDLSVVRPRSRCPACGHAIAWYDNIPLVSYLVLAGRCRNCKAPISARYPAVEFLTGLMFALCAILWGPGLAAAKAALLSALAIGLIFADLESRILPDEMTLGGLAAGFAFAWPVPVHDGTAQAILALAGIRAGDGAASLAEAALGAALPAGVLWFGGWLFEKLRHKEGLGFGDVKMLAMLGSFLGFRETLLALTAGSALGSVGGLAYIVIFRKGREYYLPFGSFLGIGALGVILFGRMWIEWYEGLF
jgi:leader peptidase (prepilin peptidase)/N-methyltransferase